MTEIEKTIGEQLADLVQRKPQRNVFLIISDTWSADDLNKLSLDPTTALNLLGLCRRFEITKAIKSVEAAADASIQNIVNIMDTKEFLEMSRGHLETILSCERVPLEEKEIFECASRWAAHQCVEKKLELTGQNFRTVLGFCFFEIRFPTMKAEDFWVKFKYTIIISSI